MWSDIAPTMYSLIHRHKYYCSNEAPNVMARGTQSRWANATNASVNNCHTVDCAEDFDQKMATLDICTDENEEQRLLGSPDKFWEGIDRGTYSRIP